MKKPLSFILLIIILFSFNSCVKDPESDLQNPILSICTNPSCDQIIDSIDADGVSKKKILIKLGKNSDASEQITLTTSDGFLAPIDLSNTTNNTIQVTSVNHQAEAYIISGNVSKNDVSITAKIENYSLAKTICFKRSFPDTFFVTPNVYFTTGNEIQINVNLFRAFGYISKGIPIYFSARVDPTSALKTSIDPFIITSASNVNPIQLNAALKKENTQKGIVYVDVTSNKQTKTISVEFQ